MEPLEDAALQVDELPLALTWIAVIAGLSAKSTDGAGAFSYPIILLIASALAMVAYRRKIA